MKANTFRKSITLYALAILICVTLFLTLFSTASGRPFRMGMIPDKGKGFGCGTCHINPRGGGARNSFGYDYERIAIKAGEKYTGDLGSTDSDGDGVSNDQEFEAVTHPGDPNSKP
jgi:hypothetical protein